MKIGAAMYGLDNIFNWSDEETVRRQLEEYPLAEGHVRMYTDHTSRFFEDYPQDVFNTMMNDDFLKILQEEIKAELDKEMLSVMKEVK
jgi:hypothetical protein